MASAAPGKKMNQEIACDFCDTVAHFRVIFRMFSSEGVGAGSFKRHLLRDGFCQGRRFIVKTVVFEKLKYFAFKTAILLHILNY